MRRSVALLPLLLLLAVAPAAQAKFSSARVCGARGCAKVTFADGNELAAVEEAYFGGVDVSGSQIGRRVARTARQSPRAAPWYRVTLCPQRCRSRYARTLRVLPATGYEYLGRSGWVNLGRRAVAAYRKITAGLRPLPADRLLSFGARVRGAPGDALGSQGPPSDGGVPGWAWLVLAAPAAFLLLPRRWRRPRRSSPGR